MIPRKLDYVTLRELRAILGRLDIKDQRVTIDFDKETIELEDDYSVDDLLESAGALSPERVKELREEIRVMREEWDWMAYNGYLFDTNIAIGLVNQEEDNSSSHSLSRRSKDEN